jgi:membrane protein implicated in regulation of membrane protease activity
MTVMWWLIFAVVAVAASLLAVPLWLLVRPLRAPSVVGVEAFLGRRAVVRLANGDGGWVVLDGARWAVHARGARRLQSGQRVRIVGRCGLHLLVDPEVRPPRLAA